MLRRKYKKLLSLHICRDRSCDNFCGATLLDADASTHCVLLYADFVNAASLRLAYTVHTLHLQFALGSPFTMTYLPARSGRRLSEKDRHELLTLLQRFTTMNYII